MAAIDLLLRNGLQSEHLHQRVLVSLLRNTTLPELLVPGFGLAAEVVSEPRGGTYDMGMSNGEGRTVLVELKVDARLANHQIGNQLRALGEVETLSYLLLGHTRLTARPRLDGYLAAHASSQRCRVHELCELRQMLTRVEVNATSADACDARDLLSAYRNHLAMLAERTDGFFDHLPSEWNGPRWGYYYGYFEHCRRTIPGLRGATICYVPNQSKGFRVLHFHWVEIKPEVQA